MSKNWRGVKVLVTGAGGFIGSHLTEELAKRGAKVRAVVHYNSRNHWGFLERLDPEVSARVDILPGDVTDPYCMLEAAYGQEVVFHLAAQIAIPYSYVAPQSFVSTNVNGTLNVLEACRRRRVKKMVHTSTSEVYGTALYVPIDEKHARQGQSPYSASKIAADALVESYHRSFDLPVAISRPFNTYGPRQSARAVIPTIISQLAAGHENLKLGSLTPVRDFNYVADTVEGFLAVAASVKTVGQDVNLGSGRGVTVGQTIAMIAGLMGRKYSVRRDAQRIRPGKSEVLRLLCDNRKARRLCGWRPTHTLENGLGATINYVTSQLSQYKPALYNI